MCKWGDTITMELTVPAGLSHIGKEYKKPVDIDKCIAPIVKALNDAGIITVASCCGHEKMNGIISLADGRQLEIYPDFDSWEKAKAKEKNVKML